MLAAIQRLIDQETKLGVPAADLPPSANLYALGLTPFDAIRLLVAIEREFKVEFPRAALKRDTMASVESIAKAMQPAPAVEELRQAA